MEFFVKSLRLQKNVLSNIIQQRTRVFSGIINVKLNRQNSIMRTLVQQRLYAANSSLSCDHPDTMENSRGSASLLSKHSDSPTSFAPTTEFTSTSLLDNQTEQTTCEAQTNNEFKQDWSKSFFGLSVKPFPKETVDILLAPIEADDIECKPDGMLYLPEIKYRRILNRAFGPGGWGLAPRGENSVSPKTISREYALVCHGRLVSVSRGEQEYFDPSGLATAAEGAKSNALMRCCKDLGIASELWDPCFIRDFKKKYIDEIFVEHVVNKRRRKIWVRKGHDVEYPFVRV